MRKLTPDTFLRTPPKREWYQTPSGGWASREWKPGEQAAYVRRIAHRWGKPV